MKAKAQPPTRSLVYSPPRAFTLIELLLVLGLVGLAAAWAAPAWQGQLAHQRLESAAKDLRTTWQETRLEAVEQAVPYRFEIVPGSGHWRVLPVQPVVQRIGMDKGGQAAHATRRPRAEGLTPSVSTTNQTRDTREDRTRLGLLPDGVRFFAPRFDAGFDRDENPQEAVAPASEGDVPAVSDWIPWIVFHPRGTVSDARLVIEAPEIRQRRRLTLRGLTGRVRIDTAPYSEDE